MMISTNGKLRYVIVAMLLLSPLVGVSQSYSSDQVEAKANKALQKLLPSHLIPATDFYYPPYYLAETTTEEWSLLEKGKKTKGKLKTVKVRYKLSLRHTACSNYKDLNVVIELELNNKLELVKHTGTEEIPDFIMNNQPCPLISLAEVSAIAMKNGVSLDERNVRLYFDPKTRRFTYSEAGFRSMSNNAVQDSTKKIKFGSLKIDGETGEVTENTMFEGTGQGKK